MPRKGFTEEQIGVALRQAEAGTAVAEICRKHVEEFSLSAMMRDLEAVADRTAPGSFVLLANGNSSSVAVAYAAAYPGRVSHLLFFGPRGDAHVESLDRLSQLARTDWRLATESYLSAVDNWSNPEDARAWAAMMRRSVSPETFIRYEAARKEWDISDLAPRVRAPTLVAHPRDHPYYSSEVARSLAAAIPGARLALTEGATVLMPGPHALATMSEFLSDLTGFVPRPGSTTLPSGTAIIVFADIADSTGLTERLGDAAFRAKARGLDAALRTLIRDHAGTPIEGKLLGDGVLAVFTSARQAIEAASACAKAGEEASLPLHLGLHAGDVIREENNVYGGAVNVASRISGLSAPAEVLVSDVVRTLARTSAAVRFEDRGEQSLKGIDDPVRVWAVREVK